MEKQHISTLTSLRFIAVMLIVVHHLRQEFIPRLLTNENFGVLGVTFFLMLSGFVINLRYGRMTRLQEALFFLWNRIVRIYPLHLLTFTICVLIYLRRGIPIHLPTAIINGLLLQSFFPLKNIYFSFNALSWILSTLFFFYLMFALARVIPRLFPFIILLSLASLLLSVYFIETNPRGEVLWFRLWLLYIFPLNRLVTVFIGMAASRVFIINQSRLTSRLGLASATALEAMALLLMIDFIAWGGLTGFVHNAFLSFTGSPLWSIDFLNKNYISGPLPVFMLLSIFALEKGLVSRILQARIFILLGEMSFSIFITHQIIINYFLSSYKAYLFSALGQPMTVILATVFIIGVSLLTYRAIEEPIRKGLRVSGTG